MKRLPIAAVCIVPLSHAAAETRFDAGRHTYVMMKEGTGYCPRIEPAMNGLLLIEKGYRYDPAADGEYQHARLRDADERVRA